MIGAEFTLALGIIVGPSPLPALTTTGLLDAGPKLEAAF